MLMNQLASLDTNQLGLLKSEIQKYKDGRANIAAGKVYHILPPSQSATDAIESYNAELDTATAVVTRAQSQGSMYIFGPKVSFRKRGTWSGSR